MSTQSQGAPLWAKYLAIAIVAFIAGGGVGEIWMAKRMIKAANIEQAPATSTKTQTDKQPG